MCGIAAIYAFGASAPPAGRAELARITEAMRRRGPDGDGIWLDAGGRIGLGHRRLAIIDPGPSGAQPMRLDGLPEDRSPVITYNGEIYNFRALRAELEQAGRRFASQSDTEVLLHLYDRDGPAMVEKLRGMFALAIWDPVKQGLFLARDPFGIKPLYYAQAGGVIRAASQVKALLAGGEAGKGRSAAAEVGFHLFGYVPEPHTLFEDIYCLPAGATMWIDGNGPGTPRPYFDPAAAYTQGGETVQLADALEDTVRHHLVADVPVGLFLSAGLDSATIAAHAQALSATPLRSVTLGFDELAGTAGDESPLARLLAGQQGTDHREERIARADFLAERDAILAAMDQPSIDGVNTYFVAKAAADAGLKVALSGVGGDELFGGYDTFRDVPQLVGGLGWIPGLRLFGQGIRAVAAPLIKERMSPKYAGLLEYASDYGSAYLLRRGLFMPWELPEVLDPDVARDGWAQLAPLIRLNETADKGTGARAKIALLETLWYLENQLLRDADWAGMAHSLEIRTPLVDRRLFAGVAPLEAGKDDMAATAPKALPAEILNRPKTGFFIPVRDWLAGEDGGSGRGLRGWARQVRAGVYG